MKWPGSPDSGPLLSAMFPDTIGGVLDGPPAAGCPSSPTCPVIPAEFEAFQAQGLSSLGHLCISGVYEGDSGERVVMLRWFCTGTRGPESSVWDSWKWNRERRINILVAQPIHPDSCRSTLIPDPRFPSSPEGVEGGPSGAGPDPQASVRHHFEDKIPVPRGHLEASLLTSQYATRSTGGTTPHHLLLLIRHRTCGFC